MIGRVADLAFVGGMALRVARPQGWIDSAQIDQFGEDPDVNDHRARLIEVVLTGAALGRLIRRKKRSLAVASRSHLVEAASVHVVDVPLNHLGVFDER